MISTACAIDRDTTLIDMNMHSSIPSMRKSELALTGATCLLAFSAIGTLLIGGGAVAVSLSVTIGLVAVALGTLAYAGRLTQQRQRRLEAGQSDLFLELNASRSEVAVSDGQVPRWSEWRRWVARRFFGHSLLVGDGVQVKSLDAIRATLDTDGCLEGLPFMDEMAVFCGRSLRVYRVVDKIYDYGRSRLMRRLDDCLLLVGQRCDGSAHEGCEAACYLIWKSAWLEEVGVGSEPTPAAARPANPALPGERLSCQYTQLSQASQPVTGANAHGLLGPLIVGNVTLAAFSIAALTRSFNALQTWRGGATYPSKPPPSDDKSIRGESLTAGDWVRVKLPAEIARAMDKNSKNRGLWFDSDMLKHCGQVYPVRGRVEKIIDVGSGMIIPMKTPCIVLEGVHYSGEFQGFGEQHDFLYWREAWLDRISPPGHHEPRGEPAQRPS